MGSACPGASCAQTLPFPVSFCPYCGHQQPVLAPARVAEPLVTTAAPLSAVEPQLVAVRQESQEGDLAAEQEIDDLPAGAELPTVPTNAQRLLGALLWALALIAPFTLGLSALLLIVGTLLAKSRLRGNFYEQHLQWSLLVGLGCTIAYYCSLGTPLLLLGIFAVNMYLAARGLDRAWRRLPLFKPRHETEPSASAPAEQPSPNAKQPPLLSAPSRRARLPHRSQS